MLYSLIWSQVQESQVGQMEIENEYVTLRKAYWKVASQLALGYHPFFEVSEQFRGLRENLYIAHSTTQALTIPISVDNKV